jgi:hypothetical protein
MRGMSSRCSCILLASPSIDVGMRLQLVGTAFAQTFEMISEHGYRMQVIAKSCAAGAQRLMKSSAPFSTPESRDALERLKELICINAPAGKIEAHAFRLVGESQETIDRETHELFEALFSNQSPPLPRSTAFGLAFALRELVCERIREIESSGRGYA